MKLPRMTSAELAIFAACYAQALSRQPSAADNSAHECALDVALWDLRCFRKALRDREEDQ